MFHRVLFLVFFAFSVSSAVGASGLIITDEDSYYPFPWGVKCNVEMNELEGDWLVRAVFDPESRRVLPTKGELGGFQFKQVKKDSISGEIIFSILRYNQKRKITHAGHGLMAPNGDALAVMSKVNRNNSASSDEINAWIFTYAYVRVEDPSIEPSGDLCQSGEVKRTIVVMPRFPQPEGSVYLYVEQLPVKKEGEKLKLSPQD